MACDVTTLSHQFESNGNPSAIGFDADGSYSYGLYQIATKQGAMQDFLRFLQPAFPDLWTRLNAAGGNGAALMGAPSFKQAWTDLATQAATRSSFIDAQNQFVVKSYFTPALARLKAVGIDLNTRSCALWNSVLSLSVMAGPGLAKSHGSGVSGLIFDAVQAVGGISVLAALSDEALLSQVYACKLARIDNKVEYKNVTDAIRIAVRNRVVKEEQAALALLSARN